MTHASDRRRGFTFTDLVIVLTAVALLVAVVVPALGRLRGSSGFTVSMSNLVTQHVAHLMYAADWDGRQFTVSRDDFGAHGNNLATYLNSPVRNYFIPLGWSQGNLWVFVQSPALHEPLVFQGPGAGFGSFRIYNFPTGFHDYVNGRTYDPIFFAPNDTVPFEFVEAAFDDPDELVLIGGPFVRPPSYALSPAAMFHPQIMRAPSAGGWQNPWNLADGFASPPLFAAAYPDLKTHMIEHHWVQSPPAECNPVFGDNGPYGGCQPYFFNQGIDSVSVALFFDGHVRSLPNSEVFAADQQILKQTGGVDGLWSRDTPLGADGYFIESGFDGSPLSHHVLTTDGILGRDTLGPGLPMPPLAQAKRSRQSAVVPRTPNPPAVMMSRVKP